MRSEIKRLFEMLTWRFLKLFLPQCPQDAPPFPAPALPNPQILLSDYPGTNLTWQNFYWFLLLLFPDILQTTYDIPSSNVPPSCTPTTPYCAAATPSCQRTTPSCAATTPGFPGGDHLSRSINR